MNRIQQKLDGIFINFPDTEENRAAREKLEEMMYDKYDALVAEGKSSIEAYAIVNAELGDLESVKEELGITEYAGPMSSKGMTSAYTDEKHPERAKVIRIIVWSLVGIFGCLAIFWALGLCGFFGDHWVEWGLDVAWDNFWTGFKRVLHFLIFFK